MIFIWKECHSFGYTLPHFVSILVYFLRITQSFSLWINGSIAKILITKLNPVPFYISEHLRLHLKFTPFLFRRKSIISFSKFELNIHNNIFGGLRFSFYTFSLLIFHCIATLYNEKSFVYPERLLFCNINILKEIWSCFPRKIKKTAFYYKSYLRSYWDSLSSWMQSLYVLWKKCVNRLSTVIR